MSLFRTIAVYLGLGPDHEYDDSYLYDEPADDGRSSNRAAANREPEPARSAPVAKAAPRRSAAPSTEETSAVSAVRPLRPVPEGSSSGSSSARAAQPVRQQPREADVPSDTDPAVRPAPVSRSKPSALSPQTFADAKVVADEFKQSIPVILNLQGLDRDLVRRLVDFSSGLCYGLDGTMEKIASQVFLLTPQSVKVTAEERRRIEERGFDR